MIQQNLLEDIAAVSSLFGVFLYVDHFMIKWVIQFVVSLLFVYNIYMCGTLAKHNTQKENVVKTLIERIKKTTKRLNTLTILNRHISLFPFWFSLALWSYHTTYATK